MAVAFDAVGAGSSSGSSFVGSLTWSHTPVASGAYVVAFVNVQGNDTVAVTCGGTSMTQLGSVALNNNTAAGILYMFGLSGVSSGAKSVAATFTGGTLNAIGNSVSYTGVTSVGTVSTNFGSSTSASQALTCTTGQMLVHGFAASNTFTSPTGGTSRYNSGTTGSEALLIQDSTASATFAATLTTGNWAGTGAVLASAAPIPTGLFFHFI